MMEQLTLQPHVHTSIRWRIPGSCPWSPLLAPSLLEPFELVIALTTLRFQVIEPTHTIQILQLQPDPPKIYPQEPQKTHVFAPKNPLISRLSLQKTYPLPCPRSTLEFQVVVPTAAHFVNQFVKANGCENPRHAEAGTWMDWRWPGGVSSPTTGNGNRKIP